MIKINLEKLEELDYARNEAFKSLRTNLSFCGADIKKILLTSCTPNEGKSTVSFYLAKALADDGKKVIFIDADLRKSVLMGRLGVKAEGNKTIKGLSHYLTKQASLEEVICETNVEGLMMIFSGPVTPNPTELLGNAYMEEAMQALTEIADYVIFMAYDQYGISATEAGTTAGADWVEVNIKKFIGTQEEVDKDKLILGMPFYTRLWKETDEKTTSAVVTMKYIDSKIPNGVNKTWDEDLKQYYVE